MEGLFQTKLNLKVIISIIRNKTLLSQVIKMFKQSRIFAIWILLILLLNGMIIISNTHVDADKNRSDIDLGIKNVEIISTLTSLINPYFVKGVIEPFTIFHDFGVKVQENLPINSLVTRVDKVYIPAFQTTVVLILVFALSFNAKTKFLKENFVEFALFLTFTIGAIYLARLTAIYGISLALFTSIIIF